MAVVSIAVSIVSPNTSVHFLPATGHPVMTSHTVEFLSPYA